MFKSQFEQVSDRALEIMIESNKWLFSERLLSCQWFPASLRSISPCEFIAVHRGTFRHSFHELARTKSGTVVTLDHNVLSSISIGCPVVSHGLRSYYASSVYLRLALSSRYQSRSYLVWESGIPRVYRAVSFCEIMA